MFNGKLQICEALCCSISPAYRAGPQARTWWPWELLQQLEQKHSLNHGAGAQRCGAEVDRGRQVQGWAVGSLLVEVWGEVHFAAGVFGLWHVWALGIGVWWSRQSAKLLHLDLEVFCLKKKIAMSCSINKSRYVILFWKKAPTIFFFVQSMLIPPLKVTAELFWARTWDKSGLFIKQNLQIPYRSDVRMS